MDFPIIRFAKVKGAPSTATSSKEFSIRFHEITVWYSYLTPIAFKIANNERVVRQNPGKATTGKHLNNLDGHNKAARVNDETFYRLWNEQVEPIFNKVYTLGSIER